MNLYEALKHGASAEDLITTFKKQLDEASARLEKETKEEKEREKALSTARIALTEAIGHYAKYYNGVLDSENKVNDFIEGFEDEISHYFKNPYVKAKNKLKDNEANTTSHTYDGKTLSDIILDFLEA